MLGCQFIRANVQVEYGFAAKFTTKLDHTSHSASFWRNCCQIVFTLNTRADDITDSPTSSRPPTPKDREHTPVPPGVYPPTACKRRGNSVKGCKHFYLKGRARIWLWLSYIGYICSATDLHCFPPPPSVCIVHVNSLIVVHVWCDKWTTLSGPLESGPDSLHHR